MPRTLSDEDVEAIAARVVALLGASLAPHRIESDAIYSINAASKLVELHPETLRKQLRLGLLKGSRWAGDWRIRGAELLKLA